MKRRKGIANPTGKSGADQLQEMQSKLVSSLEEKYISYGNDSRLDKEQWEVIAGPILSPNG